MVILHNHQLRQPYHFPRVARNLQRMLVALVSVQLAGAKLCKPHSKHKRRPRWLQDFIGSRSGSKSVPRFFLYNKSLPMIERKWLTLNAAGSFNLPDNIAQAELFHSENVNLSLIFLNCRGLFFWGL